MSLGGFGMVTLLSKAGFEAENLEDFKGLNSRSPWLAFMMLVLMLSMAGIPPTVGFMAKLLVLKAVINAGYLWLAVGALVFALIGAFYYLRVIKYMYFDSPEDQSSIVTAMDSKVIISLNSMAMIILGIFPAALLKVCLQAFGS